MRNLTLNDPSRKRRKIYQDIQLIENLLEKNTSPFLFQKLNFQLSMFSIDINLDP